jgi:hypothetical protein
MKHLLPNIVLCSILLLTLSSCGTSKSVLKLMDSYEYGIKKIHIENRNSTYDRLVSDYYESLKSTDQIFAEQLAKDTMIFMSKGSCLGRCPVYSITIFNNGRVKYDGVNNVAMEGIYESKLEGSTQADLRALIDKIDLVRMYNRYPRGVNMVADVATTKFLISDGVLKFPTVISYGQPDEIKDLERFLEQLVGDLSWVQI